MWLDDRTIGPGAIIHKDERVTAIVLDTKGRSQDEIKTDDTLLKTLVDEVVNIPTSAVALKEAFGIFSETFEQISNGSEP
jgi:hypothetical protein